MFDSLWTHRLQHSSIFCPPLLPGVCSNSCPLRWWSYLTILSSTVPFSFCLQSFLASGSFPMSQLFTSGGQNIGALVWPSVLPMNNQCWFFFRIDWFDLLTVQRTLKSILQHQNLKASILWCSAFFMVQLSHLYMTTGKTITLTRLTFVSKVMSLLFNMLSRLVISCLPSSKHLLVF